MSETAGPGAGGRRVEVAPERLAGWLQRFADRHGEPSADRDAGTVTLTAPDGAVAWVEVPFPPLEPGPAPVQVLVDHVGRARRLAAVLVRRGGFAVGLFDGATLVASKVGGGYVQSRTKAGGWSQHRYARRRDNQASHLYGAAADVVARLLLPELPSLDGLFGGGDQTGVRAVLDDPRLGGLADRLVAVLPAPDPRLRVLEEFGQRMRAVSIRLNDLA